MAKKPMTPPAKDKKPAPKGKSKGPMPSPSRMDAHAKKLYGGD